MNDRSDAFFKEAAKKLTEAKNELLTKQVHRINRMNKVIQQLPKTNPKGNRKDFKNAMKQIVNIGH